MLAPVHYNDPKANGYQMWQIHQALATVMLSLSMFASLTPFALSSHEISNKTEISDTTAPRISQYAEAYLFTDVYTDIISDNNWIDAVVTVTNHSNNPGGVRVYVSNEQGDMIGRVNTSKQEKVQHLKYHLMQVIIPFGGKPTTL